ncbi:L-serine ammonia-lyase, iron-sulfur-dependent, subunit alpha [Marinithermus hydrothermalis]|uniref:L-serine dehydratase n=1 Tax=Marinithermus hydrothermalis (strain DSM 14884 / JCM 11576 / T1) TaxID=869210 RepID=F2NP51_MARHT|nr:L-serine ammonia-lyase, iron-sulfur-dependent, subunit alpha [Marinithermus hydrothermalis]AEB11852.1 L-serine dehydratase, iron-sulfur-dependent, alpha subunit [Marinithermus hydrothermalis DSM 14884]
MSLTLNALAELTGRASEHLLAEEVEESGLDREAVLSAMRERLAVMRESITRGLQSDAPSVAGMVGWNAKTLWDAPDPLNAPLLKRVQAYAMAVNEENARMGRIVAAPTAGSAGTVPGALIGVADHLGLEDEDLVMPLVLAAGVGKIISRTIYIAGASGGCQAEIGSSAAMAAAAVTELLGGGPEACAHAAALALQNTLGLVCDPVGGFVEVPCVMRNGFYAVHAVSAAQQALAGIRSVIPPDEVILAMASIGRLLPLELKETGEGGLADTPTGRKLAARALGEDEEADPEG